ncbi:hypothetical protein Q8A67_025567 [Cirrhinus molitorella]|uniref:Uncharacterized protein n=1 Tax=Cirrhinus molitorella TaxID=172907 RepID=A0AA88THX8_9TELE|nr:hypothetical protein Q8A67_025567 [Cirrhinus molitorella]
MLVHFTKKYCGAANARVDNQSWLLARISRTRSKALLSAGEQSLKTRTPRDAGVRSSSGISWTSWFLGPVQL